MMNIFKIKLTSLFWITSFIVATTGHFKEFLLFMSLILIHELGHSIMAYFLKWNVKQIEIYPFGGMTILEEKLNRSMKEELLILLSGPIFQMLYFSFLNTLFLLPRSVLFSHYALLFFNLLPIYPLDGGRIFFLFYQTIFPYLLSHKILIFTSYTTIFLFFLFFFHKISIFLFLFFFLLLLRLQEEKRKEKILYYRFLFERILYSFSFPYQKIILGPFPTLMKRDTYHFFQWKDKLIKEEDFLRKMFDLR